jgi:hypothetical protein
MGAYTLQIADNITMSLHIERASRYKCKQLKKTIVLRQVEDAPYEVE